MGDICPNCLGRGEVNLRRDPDTNATYGDLCQQCDGSGAIDPTAPCPECRGAGETHTGNVEHETGYHRTEPCWTCNGDGFVRVVAPATERRKSA